MSTANTAGMMDKAAVEAVANALDPLTEPGTRTLGDMARAAIKAYEQHLEAQGMVVVPREPNEEMLAVGSGSLGAQREPRGYRAAGKAFAAMIGAANGS